MNIRVKLADFNHRFEFSALNCTARLPVSAVSLPENCVVETSQPEKIGFRYRLFHLHSKKEADELLDLVGRETGADCTIVQPGEKWNGKGIDRWWVIGESCNSEQEARALFGDLSRRLPPDIIGRMKIEGGLFYEYPPQPISNVRILTAEGEEIYSDKIIRLRAEAGITLKQAPVGETFHWEHSEDLRFNGIIELRAGQNGVLVINEIPLEEYLASVNSSEMSAQAPLEFLKAQTIAARSTVAATKGCHHYGEPFDLCNGDHCQCYYGVSRIHARSRQAAQLTAGQVLCHNGIIADTRYAKTCGGVMETFDNVWENFDPAYLQPKFDGIKQDYLLEDAGSYISARPDCWCNPELHPYPDYFEYAKPYFRWIYKLGNRELALLLKNETGIDAGVISDIKILRRGKSGRIVSLKIIGENEIRLDGELNIRRAFSDSHLPSSCFVIDREGDKFTLRGAGWGHGVGMCQMGAINMSLAGHTCEEILAHYYPGAEPDDL